LRQGAIKKVKSGGTSAYRDDSVLIMGWEDKMMLMMSSYHDESVEKVVTVQKGSSRKKIKSLYVCTLPYNTYEYYRLQNHYCTLLHHICFHSEILKMLEKTLSGAWKCAL
jgi:hypothetical protein